jgi:glycosyltransferase involved in cell wall biosynthesis
MPTEISPLVLTYNEAPNLRRTLQRLAWAKEVIVVDSFSTDETLSIAAEFPNVCVVQHKFEIHARQWDYGVLQTIAPWVLALDADYVLSEALIQELKAWQPDENIDAAFVRFRYCIFGRPLRGTLYPPRAVLFRKDRCQYIQDGHTQLLQINGPTLTLDGVIDHDDRKPLSRWLWAQDRYAVLEAQKLITTPQAELSTQDRIRRNIIFAPLLVLLYSLLVKGLIFDGWPGWYYVFQRILAEIMLSLRLLEAKLKSPSSSAD